MKTETSVKVVPSPAMANFSGKLHGGELLKLLDQVASIAARRYCKTYVVTAKVLEVNYFAPISIGDYLTITGTISKVGRTSMTVDIEVTTEAPYTGVVIESNTAKFIMVALGSDDRPTPVPPLEGESDE